jgi:plastocyanin
MKPVRVTFVPLVIAIAAFFVVLPRGGGDVELRMTGADGSFAFEPVTTEIGDASTQRARILVVNRTVQTHTVTAVAGGFDLEVQPGDSRFLEIGEPGLFEFFCRYHGSTDGMTGTVTVGDPTTAPTIEPSPIAT